MKISPMSTMRLRRAGSCSEPPPSRSGVRCSLSVAALVFVAAVVTSAGATAAPGAAAAERPSLDLSGAWEFRLDPADEGKAAKWFEGTIPFDRKIVVPGAWNAQGMAYPSASQQRDYEQKHVNGTKLLGADREADKLYHVYPGPAWYRRTVTVPPDW